MYRIRFGTPAHDALYDPVVDGSASRGFRYIYAVCPGLTETGMTQPIFDMARDAGKEHKLGSRCEMRRYGKPEELASDEMVRKVYLGQNFELRKKKLEF